MYKCRASSSLLSCVHIPFQSVVNTLATVLSHSAGTRYAQCPRWPRDTPSFCTMDSFNSFLATSVIRGSRLSSLRSLTVTPCKAAMSFPGSIGICVGRSGCVQVGNREHGKLMNVRCVSFCLSAGGFYALENMRAYTALRDDVLYSSVTRLRNAMTSPQDLSTPYAAATTTAVEKPNDTHSNIVDYEHRIPRRPRW